MSTSGNSVNPASVQLTDLTFSWLSKSHLQCRGYFEPQGAPSVVFKTRKIRDQSNNMINKIEWSAEVETYCKWRLWRCRVASSERESWVAHVTAVLWSRGPCLAVTCEEKLLSKGHVTSYDSWWVTQLPQLTSPTTNAIHRVPGYTNRSSTTECGVGRRSTVRSSVHPGAGQFTLLLCWGRHCVYRAVRFPYPLSLV